jgi:TatD DNase family protein
MIDTHCHLESELYNNLEEVINNMGNNIMIVAAIDYETSLNVLNLVNKYPNIYGVIGFHPEEVHNYDDKFLEFLEENLSNPKIVGIGEIGLDYHYTKENRDKQIDVFKKQLLLARKFNKAVVIHSRDALNDTLEIISDFRDLKIDLHCYGYSLEVAKQLLNYNIRFGIGGVVTFKNGKKLKEVVKELPLDSILIETDSPYLTPEPLRGTKNEPHNIIYIIEEIARLKEISKEEIIQATTLNAIDEFDLPVSLC